MSARQVTAPIISDCLVNLEDRVVDRYATGDRPILVGEGVAAWLQERPGRLRRPVDESTGSETMLKGARSRFGTVPG